MQDTGKKHISIFVPCHAQSLQPLNGKDFNKSLTVKLDLNYSCSGGDSLVHVELEETLLSAVEI